MSIVLNYRVLSLIPNPSYTRNVFIDAYPIIEDIEGVSVTTGYKIVMRGEDKHIIGRKGVVTQDEAKLIHNRLDGSYVEWEVATCDDLTYANNIVDQLLECLGTKGNRDIRAAKLSPDALAIFDRVNQFDRYGVGRWDRARAKGLGLHASVLKTTYRVMRFESWKLEQAHTATTTPQEDKQSVKALIESNPTALAGILPSSDIDELGALLANMEGVAV